MVRQAQQGSEMLHHRGIPFSWRVGRGRSNGGVRRSVASSHLAATFKDNKQQVVITFDTETITNGDANSPALSLRTTLGHNLSGWHGFRSFQPHARYPV